MKELSIEEKAKRYDEAIEKARKIHNEHRVQPFDVMLKVFPELKDSEGERIRKILRERIIRYDPNNEILIKEEGISQKQFLAWLEKQGEKEKDILEDAILDGNEDGLIAETIRYKNENQGEQKPTDKVEPKFKIGNWIIFNGLTLYVKDIVMGFYRTISIGGIPNSYDWNIDNVARLWTIQDAKDGDVLATKDAVFIFKHIDKTGRSLCKSYCEVIGNSELGLGFDFSINGVNPATKEQCDQLEKAMADAGYTFDFEKKELRKIEQKPAEWSEEDDKMINSIAIHLNSTTSGFPEERAWADRFMNWLKSLKYRVHPQQEWSEEDEYHKRQILRIIKDNGCSQTLQKKTEKWIEERLKSLRPQNRWEPIIDH